MRILLLNASCNRAERGNSVGLRLGITLVAGIFDFGCRQSFARAVYIAFDQHRNQVDGFVKIANFLLTKVEKKREKIEKYSFWGLCLFIAIPLPVTGAWTGSLVAAVVGMKPWKAFLSALLGVLLAGAIVTLIVYGGIGFLAWLV